MKPVLSNIIFKFYLPVLAMLKTVEIWFHSPASINIKRYNCWLLLLFYLIFSMYYTHEKNIARVFLKKILRFLTIFKMTLYAYIEF